MQLEPGRSFAPMRRLIAVVLGLIVLIAPAAGAAPFAYIANSGSNNVSVVNTATNTVTATVAVGTTPFGVAVTPDGTRVYVANSGSANVSVISTATNTVTATIAVGLAPIGVALAGPIAQAVGTSDTLIAAGAIVLVAAFVPLAFKSVRDLRIIKHH